MNPITRISGDWAWRLESQTSRNVTTGVISKSQSQAIGSKAYTSTRNGGYLPDWKERLKSHQNATTSLTGTVKEVVWEPGFSQVTKIVGVVPNKVETTDQTFGRHTAFPGNTDWQFFNPTNSASAADARARAKALAKARDKLREFSGGPFVGELRQVVQLIHSPAYALRNGLDAYVSTVKKAVARDWRNKRSVIKKRAADAWLTTVFGIQPLLKDLDDGCKALANFTTYRQDYAKYGAEAEEEFLQLLQTIQYAPISGAKINITRRVVENQSVRYYGQVRIQSQFPTGNIDHNQFGLGLDEFLPTMYEMCPWSWLLDYVSNLGDIINAASFPYCHLAWMSKTTKGDVHYDLDGSYDEKATKAFWGSAYVSGYARPGRVRFNQSNVNRVPIDTRTLYTPRLTLQLNLNAKRLTNILAVVAQRGKGVEKKWQTRSLRI